MMVSTRGTIITCSTGTKHSDFFCHPVYLKSLNNGDREFESQKCDKNLYLFDFRYSVQQLRANVCE